MTLAIVTDSTSDLSSQLIGSYDIEVIPTILIVEGKEYADGVGLSREAFYQQLPSWPAPPTTAAPSIGEFAARYEALLSRGFEQIISLHASSKLTTIINSAQQAAQDFPGKITVVDSQSISMGLGFQVLAAAETAEQGLQAALDAIDSARQRLRVYAALNTLEYAKRSGRLPAAVTLLGGLLSIKPLIEVQVGEVKPIKAVRTTRQANEKLKQLLLAEGPLEKLAILHSGAEPRAKEFLNNLMQESSQSVPRDVLLINVTTVIGTHVGPQGLGFASVRRG